MSVGLRRSAVFRGADSTAGSATLARGGEGETPAGGLPAIPSLRTPILSVLFGIAGYAAAWALYGAAGEIALVLLIPIVAISAWYGGAGSGLATACTALVLFVVSPAPPGSSGATGTHDLVILWATAGVSVAAVMLVERLRRAQHGLVSALRAHETLLDERGGLLEAVLSNEERWRVLTDAVPALIMRLTAEGEILYSNRRTIEYTGETLQQLQDDGWLRIVHPDDTAASRSQWHDAMAAGARTEFQQRVRRADGSYRRHLATVEPLREPSGEISSWLIALVDIEDLKRVEDALSQSEQQYRLLSEAMPALVALVDLQGDKQYRNNAFYEYTGLTEAEAIDWLNQGLVFEEDLLAIAEEWRRTTERGEAAVAELRVRRRDGVFRWHQVRAVPLGSRRRWLLVATDIEDRKNAERQALEALALKEIAVAQHRVAEEQLTLLVEASSGLIESLELSAMVPRILRMSMRFITADAYALWSLTDERDRWSIVAAEGLSEEYMAAFSTIPIMVDTPALREPLAIEDVATAPTLEGRRTGYEREGIRSVLVLPLAVGGENTGTLTFYYRTSHAFADAELRIGMALANLTASALGLARYHREERQVLDGLEEANDQLAFMAEELREANAAKDEFLGMVSHELKTPITMILGGSEVLTKYGDRVSAEDRETALADINESAKRLGQLVDNLLLISRLEVGDTIELEPILVRYELERTVAEFRKREPGRVFNVSIDPVISPVSAELTNLRQVLQNLLSNAIKYSPPGSPIDVTTERQGEELVVSVLDRGKGITPEELELVFEAFYRSKRTSETIGGAGIGLAVCRRLIEAQGGRIWAHPRDGGGSVFSIALRVDVPPD